MSDLISKTDLITEIDELDWYEVRNGKLIQGAESCETALYKSEDIYEIIDRMQSVDTNVLASLDKVDRLYIDVEDNQIRVVPYDTVKKIIIAELGWEGETE